MKVLRLSMLWCGLGLALGASGETLRLPVARDTWVSKYKTEADCNMGGSHQVKLKSYQEMTLLDIDPSALQGRHIKRATLHLRKRGDDAMHRVTVSTIAAEWIEGTSPRYEPQNGSSTFNHRRHPDVPWAFPGSDLTAVILGQGGTLWGMADATKPDADGWQTVAVDPRVVAARVAGISHGFLVFDDTGSEWTRDGEKFTYRTFPNRFFWSRDAGRSKAPYFTIELGEADDAPPPAPTDLRVERHSKALRDQYIRWNAGADAFGFGVWVNDQPLPRWQIPSRDAPFGLSLRDVGVKPDAFFNVMVKAVDAVGNWSEPVELQVRRYPVEPIPIPGRNPVIRFAPSPLPKLGDVEVSIIDPLDKVHAESGITIPAHAKGYVQRNHLWKAADGRINLFAARNEFVSFQVLLRGAVPALSAELAIGGGVSAEWFVSRTVQTQKGPLPDPLVRMEQPQSVENAFNTLFCDLYVPHNAPSGIQKGTLKLGDGKDRLALSIQLYVFDFTLPDHLSFLPEMNCYGLPKNEGDYYRLAHRHRTVLNRLPYSQNGSIHDGCAPVIKGASPDWSAWDRRFGPYLDGSAFADLPRRGVPLEIFYLPLHENWPKQMKGNYNGDYWADQAFPASYGKAFTDMTYAYTRHFSEKRWLNTMFHVYLNNKVNFKSKGWSRGSSPWLLDEPAHHQDYWALRYYGELFHAGLNRFRTEGVAVPRMLYRCDISRPEWQRDTLDHVLDYNVVGGAMKKYRRIVDQRKRQFGHVVVNYGSSNAIEDSNVMPVGWSWDAWLMGADGVLPWQTVGRHESWEKGDRLSLFYPGSFIGQKEPIPSMRLKAFRRGQQDVEYLTLFAALTGQSRWMVEAAVRKELRLDVERKGTGIQGAEDAGTLEFKKLRPQDLWSMRIRLGRFISEKHPKPRRRLVHFESPPRMPDGPPPSPLVVH